MIAFLPSRKKIAELPSFRVNKTSAGGDADDAANLSITTVNYLISCETRPDLTGFINCFITRNK